MSREVYRFSSVVEQLTQRWPSQQTLIMQQVNRYIEDIQLMARNLDHTGSIFQSQHFNDERHVDLETVSQNNLLSLYDDEFCFITGLERSDHDDNLGGSTELDSQDVISSAPLEHETSSLSRITGSEYPQEPSRYTTIFRNSVPTDGQHVGTLTTINPATISLRTTDSRPDVNDDRETRSILASPALSCRPEFETELLVAPSCGKNLERHTNVSRKASCQRQHRLEKLPYPWSEKNLTESLSQDLEKIDKVRMGKIVLLYNSIGSAKSLLQLKGILSMMRTPHIWTFKCNETDAKTILKSLEDLDTSTYACGLKRRILSVRFVEYRDRRLQELERDRPTQRKRLYDRPEPILPRRPTSEVLDILIREICPPQLGEEQELFESRRKKIKNRLCLARHWQTAVKCMSLGILALIPTGGPADVQNTTYASESTSSDMLTSSRFETLQDHECQVLLKLLKMKGGGYIQAASEKLTPLVKARYDGSEFLARLRLEDVEEASLHTVDLSNFLQLCDQVSDSDPEVTDYSGIPR